MRFSNLLASMLVLALAVPVVAAEDGSCAIDETLTVTVATNMALLGTAAGAEDLAGMSGVNYASFPVDLPAAGCAFSVEILSSGSPLPAMSLHFFDQDWAHLEPDAPNGDQCDGKAPGTMSWSCPVTTPGIAHVVVDGNEGFDVKVHVTAVDL